LGGKAGKVRAVKVVRVVWVVRLIRVVWAVKWGSSFQKKFSRPRFFSPQTHRATFKLGGKKIFVLCLLVKNVSAVYSADRCDFSMLNSSCYWIRSGPHGS